MVEFKIFRYDPDSDEEPGYERYEVEPEPGKTVLDALEEIKAKYDGSLAYRAACEIGVCGSCGMEINGKHRQACLTQLERDLNVEEGSDEVIEINPLPGFDVIKDLVVEQDSFFESLKEVKPYLICDTEPPEGEERLQSPEEMMRADDPMSCIMCTDCLSACPINWSDTIYPGPAVLMKVARFALDSRDTGEEERMSTIADDIWECTTCNHCGEICPKDISIPENIIEMKSYFIEKGRFPTELKDSLESMYTRGNPYQESVRKRIEWTKDLEVEHYDNQKVLWYVGCALAYDDRAQEVAKAMARLFKETGEDYGILGRDEKCCGHPAFRAGEKGLFEELSEENSNTFKDLQAETIITNCAHSYHSFVNEYPSMNMEVLHSTQYLKKIVDEISFSNKMDKRVCYHDSCYLGRYNEIYEEPREVLQKVPGLELVEMKRNRETALCCGGGSNHMWIEEPDYWEEKEKRLADMRVEEALDLDADVIAVACPFCLATLDGAVTTRGYEDDIKVMAISELVSEAI